MTCFFDDPMMAKIHNDCGEIPAVKILRFLVILAFLFPATPHCAVAQFSGNQAIASGDWFNDVLWEDDLGNNDAPNQNDGHSFTHIAGGNVITISGGNASVRDELIIGDSRLANIGSGELRLLGSGNLDVERLIVAGSRSSNTLIVDTTGTLTANAVVRIGQFIGSTESVFDMRNGTIVTNTFEIGAFSGPGRATISGGTIRTTGSNGFFVGNGGLGALNMSGGRIEAVNGGVTFRNAPIVLSGDATIETGRDFVFEGGSMVIGDSTVIQAGRDLLLQSFIGLDGDVTIRDNARLNAARDISLAFTGDNFTAMESGQVTAGEDVFVGGGIFNMTGGSIDAVGEFVVLGDLQGVSAGSARFLGNARADFGGFFRLGLVPDALVFATIGANAMVTTSDIVVGDNQQAESATMFIEKNARVTTNTGNVFVGSFSRGRLDISDDAVLKIDGQLQVGVNAFGDFSMSGNSAIQKSVADLDAFVGVSAGGEGSMRMDDLASASLDTLTVGLNGNGQLNMVGASTINVAGNMFIGVNDNSTGSVALDDDAQISVDGSLSVGAHFDSVASLTMNGESDMFVAGSMFLGGGTGTVNLELNSLLSLSTNNGNIRVGGTESQTTLTIDGTTLQGRDVIFDAGDAVDTAITVSLNSGSIQATDDVLIHRGTNATMTGGDLEASDDLRIATDRDDLAINFRQTGGRIDVQDDFRFVTHNVEAHYQLEGGDIRIDGGATFGAAFRDGATGTFLQSGGTMTVKQEFTSHDINHTISGGTLDVEGIVMIGSEENQGLSFLTQSGGTTTFQNDAIVEHARLTMEGGIINVGNNLSIGGGDNVESTLRLTGGALNVSKDLRLHSDDLNEVNGQFLGGTLRANNLIFEQGINGGTTAIQHAGSQVLVGNSLIIDDRATYDFSAGRLEALVADFSITGDFQFTDNAELVLKKNHVLDLDGRFTSVDAGGAVFSGGGVIRLENFTIDPGDGFLKLVDVTDAINLLAGDALDEIQLLAPINGTRLTEADFKNGFFGSGFAGTFFSVVEGTDFGEANSIGLAYANFSSVPEPSCSLLALIGMAWLGLRRRRQTVRQLA